MKKYLEKKTKKYVAATFDNPTMYLKKTPAKPEYCFVEDIELATKTMSKNVMDQIISYYYLDTKLDTTLVSVPLEITYEIIEEIE
jgi:hypothetical protein